ncbi:MAG: transcription antitermination protein NusB [Prevotellaceae bacterium]|jgi:N utilization substance protein B|nr:transcription antitermination protein NusB [Prevotellaceae bacterium]
MISRRLLRIKVIKELYGHVVANSSMNVTEKELILSIEKTYEQYKYLFCFLPMLQEYAQEKIDKGRQKYLPTEAEKNPNTKFINNKLVKQISENRELMTFMSKNSLFVAEAKSIIGKMYANMATKDYFLSYMNNPDTSFSEDKKLVINILTEEFENFEDLYSMLEEQSIYWTDEPEFVVSVIIRTVTKIKENTGFNLMPLYKNEDDAEFAIRLFRHAVNNFKKYNELIDLYTPSWDIERIAMMDALILVTGISELMEFPSIPVKVTLDEYIELSHYYGTPSSGVFINGVLDKLVEYFEKNGLMKKHGKGLIKS